MRCASGRIGTLTETCTPQARCENQLEMNSPSSVKSWTRLFSRSQTMSLSRSGWIAMLWGRLPHSGTFLEKSRLREVEG